VGRRGPRVSGGGATPPRPAAVALRALEEKLLGYQVLPRRWVVERTLAWLGLSRCLSKVYEPLLETGEAMIYGAMSRLMLRRLVQAA
jgi:transposase